MAVVLQELFSDLVLQGLHVLDLQPLLCGQNDCNERVPGTGTLAYWDSSHIGQAAGTYLAPFLCAYFEDLGIP